MDSKQIVQRYMELHRMYRYTDKASVLEEAEKHILNNNFAKAAEVMSELKTKDQLLANLTEELKGKPVYKTLKKVLAGKCSNVYESLKGMSSLMTHLFIELERGNLEYKPLVDEVYGMIGKVYYGR